MKRVNFYLPEKQLEQLGLISVETGAPVSELVRRAIAEYVRLWDEKNKKPRK